VKTFWGPILIGVIATPIFFLLAAFFSGGGHTTAPMILVFPYGMALGLGFSGPLSWWLIGLPAFALQYPLYGLAFSLAKAKGRFQWLAIGLAVGHGIAAALCFAFGPAYQS
jgi:hypothetical protein